MVYEELIIVGVTVTFVAILIILIRLNRLAGELSKTKMELADKVAPIQSLSGLAGGLTASASNLQAAVAGITQQAERIATLGEKYQKTEELTKIIHSILIGSYSKGRTGEQVLRKMMSDLMRIGIVETNVRFGTRVVEYAVKFPDGKILAVDSKIVGTSQLERLHAEDATEDERNKIADEIVSKLRSKIDEVAGYIDPERTLPYSVMAIPDSLMEYSPEVIGEASRRNVIVAGYSSVPPLIEYFVKIHATYSVQQDIQVLSDSLAYIHKSLSKFTETYFSRRFEQPLKTIGNAVSEVRVGVTDAIRHADMERLAAPKSEEEQLEKTIAVEAADESEQQ